MLTLLLALACAPKPAPPVEAAAVAAPEATAPTPYTADQIRDAMPTGTHIQYRLEAAGGPPAVMDWTVTDHTDTGMSMHTVIQDGAGAVLDDQGSATHTWAELRLHAAFPVGKTVRTETRTTVAAGTWDTWQYVVQDVTEDGTPVVATYSFAKDMAGPPILMVVTTPSGEVVQRMELLSRTPR